LSASPNGHVSTPFPNPDSMHHLHPIFPMFVVLLTFMFGVAAGAAMINANRSCGKKKGKLARLEARLEALERKP